MKKGPMVYITYGKEAAIYALRSKRLDIPDEFLDGITKAFLDGAGIKYQDESADNYNVGCCGSNNGILRKIEKLNLDITQLPIELIDIGGYKNEKIS